MRSPTSGVHHEESEGARRENVLATVEIARLADQTTALCLERRRRVLPGWDHRHELMALAGDDQTLKRIVQGRALVEAPTERLTLLQQGESFSQQSRVDQDGQSTY